jgi:hypothetical protein
MLDTWLLLLTVIKIGPVYIRQRSSNVDFSHKMETIFLACHGKMLFERSTNKDKFLLIKYFYALHAFGELSNNKNQNNQNFSANQSTVTLIIILFIKINF